MNWLNWLKWTLKIVYLITMSAGTQVTYFNFTWNYLFIIVIIVDSYPLAGQNIHYLWIKGKDYDNIETFLVDGTNKWFIEHKMCDMSYINKYRRPDKNIGHFCQVAKDTADRVGCAVVKYDDGTKKHMLLTCNYSVGTVLDNPIYTTGSPCSKCMSGCSNVYRGLCTSNEKSFWVNGVSRNRY